MRTTCLCNNLHQACWSDLFCVIFPKWTSGVHNESDNIYIARTCYICFVKYVRGAWGQPKSSSCTEFRSRMRNSGQKCRKFQNCQPLQVNLMNKYCVAYSFKILESSCQSRPLLNPHERMDADSHPCLAQMWVTLQLQFKWWSKELNNDGIFFWYTLSSSAFDIPFWSSWVNLRLVWGSCSPFFSFLEFVS